MSDTYQEILNRMTDRFSELTGFEPDEASDIGIRMRLLAGEVFSLTTYIEWLRQQMFPNTATGEQLDNHAKQRGLERKKGNKARGVVAFMLDMPLEYDFVVPTGTVCSTDDGILRFVTTEENRILRGSTMAWVVCEAENSGEQYNVGNSQINTVVTYLSVGLRINNSSAFSGGTEDEDDESLRKRILESYRNTPNGANAAFFKALAESVDGIQSANVYASNDPAWVIIVLGGRGTVADEQAFDTASELLRSQAPLGIKLMIQNTALVNVSINVSVSVRSGYTFASVQSNVEQAIRNFVLDLGVGENLYLAALGRAILDVDGVENYAFAQSMADVSTSSSTMLVPNQVTVGEIA